MTAKFFCSLVSLSVAALLLSACTPSNEPPDTNTKDESDVLTWNTWGGYDDFLTLVDETYPDIRIRLSPYNGGNRTGYSWAQMRADDIPDIFITSQVIDEELARERLADLSGYDFINRFPTSVLNQVSIDGGVYLLPVNYGMYGILYNQTLMEEHGWKIPENFRELEALCAEIKAEGMIPGVVGTQLTGGPFSTVFNLAKTDWLTTPEGVVWERDFLAGKATAAGMWEDTMDYVQNYIDIGMFTADPDDQSTPQLVLDYLGNRKAVFCTAVLAVNITQLPDTGDKLGMMPFISKDGSKNIYMYSPASYIGISRRLTEPENEKKLEDAIRILSLLYSPEGQAAFITDQTPCLLSALNSTDLSEDSLIYDARNALLEGRAFPMTYANWDRVLADMGQAYKEWFRGENGMDGPACIARMDQLQQSYLNRSDHLYFCESTEDFTLEETAELLGKALGSAVGADAAMIPAGTFYREGNGLRSCATGKLYKGKINLDIANTIIPASDGEYALLSMTGAQARELAQECFDSAGDGQSFPYVLVIRGGGQPEDDRTYQVAFPMGGYTEETGQAFGARVETGSLRAFLRDWLEAQQTVSPGENPWNQTDERTP